MLGRLDPLVAAHKLPWILIAADVCKQLSMGKVTIFTRDGCSFCAKAKELLLTKGVQFHEVSLSETPEWRPLLFILAGGRYMHILSLRVPSTEG